jgi:hypothetical protein
MGQSKPLNHYLPINAYGIRRITTTWMLREKAEARAEHKLPRNRRNPFARKA